MPSLMDLKFWNSKHRVNYRVIKITWQQNYSMTPIASKPVGQTAIPSRLVARSTPQHVFCTFFHYCLHIYYIHITDSYEKLPKFISFNFSPRWFFYLGYIWYEQRSPLYLKSEKTSFLSSTIPYGNVNIILNKSWDFT